CREPGEAFAGSEVLVQVGEFVGFDLRRCEEQRLHRTRQQFAAAHALADRLGHGLGHHVQVGALVGRYPALLAVRQPDGNRDAEQQRDQRPHPGRDTQRRNVFHHGHGLRGWRESVRIVALPQRELPMTHQAMSKLYTEHVEELQRRSALALERGGFDHLVVPSGSTHYQLFDDRDYPYAVNPQFKAWAPLVSNPGSWLVHTPGEKPKLVYLQPFD